MGIAAWVCAATHAAHAHAYTTPHHTTPTKAASAPSPTSQRCTWKKTDAASLWPPAAGRLGLARHPQARLLQLPGRCPGLRGQQTGSWPQICEYHHPRRLMDASCRWQTHALPLHHVPPMSSVGALRLGDSQAGGKRLATAGREVWPSRELHCHRTISSPLSWTATRELAGSLAAPLPAAAQAAHSNGGVPLIIRSFPRATLRVVDVCGLVPSIPRVMVIIGRITHTHTYIHSSQTHSLSHNCFFIKLFPSPLGLGSPDGLAEHSLCLSVGNRRLRLLRGIPPPASVQAQNETARAPGAPSAVDTANHRRVSPVTKYIHPSLHSLQPLHPPAPALSTGALEHWRLETSTNSVIHPAIQGRTVRLGAAFEISIPLPA